ncbi:hypothetical protein Hdeb2414_s0477g00901871 [Helianthus debilis subsp. tardiflorus]
MVSLSRSDTGGRSCSGRLHRRRSPAGYTPPQPSTPSPTLLCFLSFPPTTSRGDDGCDAAVCGGGRRWQRR